MGHGCLFAGMAPSLLAQLRMGARLAVKHTTRMQLPQQPTPCHGSLAAAVSQQALTNTCFIWLGCVRAAIAALGAEPEPVPEPQPAREAEADAPPRSSRQDTTARVKREAVNVKRERGAGGDQEDEYVPRSATAPDRVDLTEEVRGSLILRPLCCLA